MTVARRAALLIAASAFLPVASAIAADYDPPVIEAAEEYVPVEVGSGWYLRGDIGYTLNEPYDYFQTPDGFEESDVPVFGGVGIGYHFNDYLRAELNFGIMPTSKFSDEYVTTCEGTQTVTVTDAAGNSQAFSGPGTRNCDGSDNGSNKAYNLMANMFVDLGTYAGLTPYVGGGIGVAYNTYRYSRNERDCRNSTTLAGNTTNIFECDDGSSYDGDVQSERQYNFAYSLGAGFGYQIAQNLVADIGYQYFSVPDAKYVTLRDGLPAIDSGLDYHQIKVGLRYDLW